MKRYRLVIPLITAFSLLLGLFGVLPFKSVSNVQAASAPAGPSGSWTQTFGDEFDASSLNRAAWRSDYFPNGGNGEQQQYLSDNSHNTYLQANGMLQIVARKESLNGQPYTSGIIHTKGLFEQKYGFFEMRAKVPAGKGFWPAFWLLPDQDNWVPEIDDMEILCDNPSLIYMTYHYNNNGGSYVQTQSTFSGTNFSSGWHTFGVDWEPSAIVWYVDGVERKRFTDASAIPNMPMYVIANLAVGGNWPGSPDGSTVFPSTLDIDYIRAWKSGGSSSPTNTPVAPTSTPTARPTTAPTSAPTSAPTTAPTSGPTSAPTTAPTQGTTSNLVTNASFDTPGMSPWNSPWTFRNDLGATFAQDSSSVPGNTGSTASLKVTLPSNNSSQPWVVSANQPNKTVNAGQSYTIAFWAKASANRPVRTVVQLQNSPYTELTNQTANLTTSWTRYSYNFTPSSATNAAMLNFNLADATGIVWLDEVSICQAGTNCATPATPAPTAVPPTATARPTTVPPTATAKPTTIPPTATTKPTTVPPTPTLPAPTAVTAANLLSNGSFEASVSPWNSPWNFRNDLGATFAQDTSTAANGTRASLKAALSSSNSSQPWVVAVTQANKSLTAGQAYTITFMAKASANRPIRAIVQNQNSPYTEFTNQAANLTTSWNRFTYTFTAPSTLSSAMLNFNLASATGSVWIDEVAMCKSGTTCQ